MVSWVGHWTQCQDWQECREQACLKACYKASPQKQLWVPAIPRLGMAGTQPE